MANWQYKKTDVIPKGSESIKYDLNTMLEAEHGKNVSAIRCQNIHMQIKLRCMKQQTYQGQYYYFL